MTVDVLNRIAPLIQTSEEDTLKLIGLDGYMLLRFLLICAKVGVCGGLFSLVVLLPLYSTSNQDDVIGMNLHTMANIKAQSPRLWGPFICMYLFSGAFLYLLYKEYENFVSLRQKFFSEGDPDVPIQQLFSVVVENVPPEYRRSNALKGLFETLFPGQVSSAQISLKYGALLELAVERKGVVAKLEKSVALFKASENKERPIVKLNKEGKPAMLPCCGGEEADAIDYFQAELQRLNLTIDKFKKSGVALTNSSDINKTDTAMGPDDATHEMKFNEKDVSGTGFITFTSRRAQAAACQLTMLSSKHPSMTVFPAHAPSDIIWSNISRSLSSIKTASVVTSYIYVAGILFWASILAGVAFIAQLSTLEKILPFLKQLDPISYSLLQGQLPVVALMCSVAVLPVLFKQVATTVEGCKSVLDIRSRVFDWFFFYQLANVYLILLAGSVFGALTDVLDNPVSIVGILANSLPTVSTFFINFMITSLLSDIPLMMLRIGPLIVYKLYLKVFDPHKMTRREFLEGPLKNAPIKYEIVLPKMLYLAAVQMTFMVISPILLMISGLLFTWAFLAWKYQLCYVITPSTQLGGMFWYRLYKYSMTALFASSITMIGYMGIKEGFAQAALLIPLPFIISQVGAYTSDKFESISLDMAHDEAVVADCRPDGRGSAKLSMNFSSTFFIPRELNDTNPMEFTTPMVYRISDIPLISENGSLVEVYHKPSYEFEFRPLPATDGHANSTIKPF